MSKREFVMLAHNYNEDAVGIGSWFMSEKLDGSRAFWDGGLTRGIPTADVPFANVEKDARFRNQQVATGLWSRYGKAIFAPDWWLNKLPRVPLDGELYIERGQFQELCSTVRKQVPVDDEWRRVTLRVIDSPRLETILADGKINNTNFKKEFSGVFRALHQTLRSKSILQTPRPEFEFIQSWLHELKENDVFRIHDQQRLPFMTTRAKDILAERLFEVTTGGGEGIILRHGFSLWTPERSHLLLKVKKMLDAEATVIGYTWGRETDLGSKLLGKMGALICKMPSGQVFELSGFTEAEREMKLNGDFTQELYTAAAIIGRLHPGERVQDGYRQSSVSSRFNGHVQIP